MEDNRDKKGRFLKGMRPHNKYLLNKECLSCSVQFKPRDKYHKYCSATCYYESLKGKTTWNKGVPMKESTRMKLKENAMGKCLNTGRTHFKKGLIPWNYKGGLTDKNQLIKGSPAYKRWRANVFRRDGWSCVECGYRSCKRGDIQADHIKPFALFPELRLDENNGRTLCMECHRKTPSFKNTKMKIEDFIGLRLQTI
jgi:hypothetical protein